uniref:Uncharacterized protein n=1 Tax=Populus alba TaxID=43335 RepID=A0A4U5NLZ8_POPAL|nr:hypothetical protein D5086_0000262820 [Populus alba]
MAKTKAQLSTTLLLLLFLLLNTTITTTRVLLLPVHTLSSNRAKLIAQKLERGLGFGFWGLSWSVGWDYAINYAWRDFDYRNCTVLLREMNELLRFLGELTRSGSKLSEPLGLPGITKNVLRVAQSCYDGLSKCFINRVIKRRWCETVQREVVEGDLLRDCLELGSNDLKGLVQIVKDLANTVLFFFFFYWYFPG